jgi:hypothetical protein
VSIKIGFLLDSLIVPVWQRSIIQFTMCNSSFTHSVVVLNDTQLNSSASFVKRFFSKLDRQLYAVKHDCFNRVDIRDLLEGVRIINLKPQQTTFTDSLVTEDIEKIKSLQLDVLIRFGFRILKGEILCSAPYGVWSLHHGDNAVNRGGPPGFWEVVTGEAVTGVTLQQLTSSLDGGIVIDRAFIRTDRTSFNRNQNALFHAGVELFCNALSRLADGSLPALMANHQQQLVYYSKPLYRNPGNVRALAIFISFWWRRVNEVSISVFGKQKWSLYYKYGSTPFETALYRFRQLKPPSDTEWADPFVVYHNNRHYVFLEELVRENKRAHISCLEFDNGKPVSEKPIKVLAEYHHLSYPFVFEEEGNFYMIPEAAQSKLVWVYRSESFPAAWKKHKLLLDNVELYDPTLLRHEGRWYLFGTQKPLEGSLSDQYLYIYHADNWQGDWQAHTLNPVKRDVRGARPAGRFFEHEGRLIRPAQIGAPKYGYGIQFYEVLKLTPTDFEERELDSILPHWKPGLRATHTFNFAEGLTLVDTQE